MSIETYQFNLPITPGAIPPVLHLSQYDSGRTFAAILRDDANVPFELDASATAVIKGRNAAGIAWQQNCSVSGANVTFTPSGAATDQFGVMPVTIEITESEEIISPLCVVFHIQKAGYTNEEAVLSPDFETAIQAAVAQAIAEGGLGFSDEFKEALLACFNGVAWATAGGQALVDDLEAALYPDVHLVSITAAYDQDRPIYDSDSAADNYAKVKLDLIVTANYSDGTSEQLADDAYTLSGTLTEGISTITVTYGGKTTTFEVTVMTTRLYTLSNHVFNGTGDYVDTGIDLLSTDKNLTIAVDVDMTASLESKGVTNWSITSCIYGSSPYDGLELKANNQSPYYGSIQYMGSWLASNNLITDFNQSTTGRARFVITHANGSGILKLQVKVGDNAIASRTITASFSAKQRLNARVGGNATSQFFAGTMTNYIIDSVVWSDAKIAEFFS